MDAKDQLESLIETYNGIFRMCYDALAADAPQSQRDGLRKSLSEFLDESPDTEE
jgi:hypothetical protein